MVFTHLLLMIVSAPASFLLWASYAFVAGFFVSTSAQRKQKAVGERKKQDGDADAASSSATPPRQLRVGFIHPDFGIGGAENLVVNAMLALQRKRAHVSMFTAHHDKSHCFEETRGDGPLARHVHVYGDWLPKTLFGKCYAACAWLRVLYVTLAVGFVHASELDAFFVDQVSVSVPLLRYFGKPVLFYGHFPDKLLAQRSGSLLQRAYRAPLDWLEEATTAAADAVLVNSAFTRGVFAESFPRVARRQALDVLYPPVDVRALAAFAPATERRAALFVSLNRFERKKHVALAIRALGALRERVSPAAFEHVRLVVAGGYDPQNAENLAHLEELKAEAAQLALEAHVEFRTSVPDAAKKELLATAAAVLYTPSNEHFGIVPVEAMACATPVVAVRSGGPLESVADGDTGFLCAPTPEAFADAMATLMEDAERASAMGARGQQRAKELFSLEAFADALYEAVESLV